MSIMNIPLALYLHIPFCAVRCHYCDFNTYAGLDGLFDRYAAALIREIRTAGAAWVTTIPQPETATAGISRNSFW